MNRALLFGCVLAVSCATSRSAEQEDDERLGRSADRERARSGGASSTDEELAERTRPEPQPQAEPQQKQASSSLGQQAAASAADMARRLQESTNAAAQACSIHEGRPIPFREERLVGNAQARRLLGEKKLSANKDATLWVQTVGAWLASGSQRPSLPWTFGVIEDDATDAFAMMGGTVLVTSGIVSSVQNEAELAAVLARGIASISLRAPVTRYAQGKTALCRQMVTGAALSAAGAGGIPGGGDFVSGSKFAMTAQKFAAADWFDDDARVDNDYVMFMTLQMIDLRSMSIPPEERTRVDAAACELMASAGYDPAAYSEGLSRSARPAEPCATSGGFGSAGAGKKPPKPASLKSP